MIAWRRLAARFNCALHGHDLVRWDYASQSWYCECGTRAEKGWDRLGGGGWFNERP